MLAVLTRGVSRRLAAQAEENAHLAAEAAQVETLRELDRLKSEFLATIGHELRTPLASIKGFASALRQDDVPLDAETQRDFARTIELDADRLTRLVQDLLETSRTETGTLRVEPAPASLAEVVERELAMAQPLLQAHETIVSLPPELPLGCFDDCRVGQVLRNLWENAARHAPAGSRITTAARVADGWLEVAVLDEGPGVPVEELEAIFAPVHRGGREKEDGTWGGMGVGLAICRGVVAAHGGCIWVENRRPGPGAVFRFTLPLAAAPWVGAQPVETATVLLVEDDTSMLKFVASTLRHRGYEVQVARDGVDALELLGSGAGPRAPGLVVLDLGLPRMDGFEVLDALRRWSRVPVLVLSAHGQEEEKVRALDMGADDYLTKPFGVPELLARVRAALRRASGPAAEAAGPFVSGGFVMDFAHRRVTVDWGCPGPGQLQSCAAPGVQPRRKRTRRSDEPAAT